MFMVLLRLVLLKIFSFLFGSLLADGVYRMMIRIYAAPLLLGLFYVVYGSECEEFQSIDACLQPQYGCVWCFPFPKQNSTQVAVVRQGEEDDGSVGKEEQQQKAKCVAFFDSCKAGMCKKWFYRSYFWGVHEYSHVDCDTAWGVSAIAICFAFVIGKFDKRRERKLRCWID